MYTLQWLEDAVLYCNTAVSYTNLVVSESAVQHRALRGDQLNVPLPMLSHTMKAGMEWHRYKNRYAPSSIDVGGDVEGSPWWMWKKLV